MKTKTKWLAALVGIAMIATGAAAQTGSTNYWVVEGNVRTNDYTLIRFYDASNKLVHEEKLDGRFLDITKRNNVRLLNEKLRAFEAKDMSVKKAGRKIRRRAV